MKITLTFELDEKTAELFVQSSIERVINTSLDIIATTNHEYEYINQEDWVEWKPVICTVWCAIHDAVFRHKNAIPPSTREYELRVGGL